MEDNNWSSIDLYYKGFHIKKSWPEDKDAEALKSFVEKAISLGFEPSWNSQTSDEHLDPVKKIDQAYGKQSICQHPEDKLEVKISNSEKNKGRKYARCTLCNSFVRWA